MAVSTTGRLMKYILKGLNVLPNLQQTQVLKKATENSYKPYHLSLLPRRLFKVSEYRNQNDVLEVHPKVNQHSQIIFYLHGGGYWDQPSIMHYRMLKKIANQSKMRIIMPIYPKAPAHQAEEVIKWTVATFQNTLVSENVSANQVILMGDSAGAGLAMSLLQVLKKNHKELPAQSLLISPWFDMSDSNPDMQKVQPFDPMLDIQVLNIMANGYRGQYELNDPLISPLYADFSNMTPLTVITGTYDVLSPDALKFQELANQRGWNVKTFVYQNMYHDFPEIPIPEGKQAIKQLVSIINN